MEAGFLEASGECDRVMPFDILEVELIVETVEVLLLLESTTSGDMGPFTAPLSVTGGGEGDETE